MAKPKLMTFIEKIGNMEFPQESPNTKTWDLKEPQTLSY